MTPLVMNESFRPGEALSNHPSLHNLPNAKSVEALYTPPLTMNQLYNSKRPTRPNSPEIGLTRKTNPVYYLCRDMPGSMFGI